MELIGQRCAAKARLGMPHLQATRKGWQSEHLGRFILSKIAFCANPVTVADDLGSDLFCCLFEVQESRGIEVVVPLNSFAIQLKSSMRTIDVSNKIQYLRELELPFFVGVVDQTKLALSIYSGEYLPLLFAEKKPPKKLRIKPVNRQVGVKQYNEEYGPERYKILFPRVARVSADASPEELKSVARSIHAVSRMIHGNIASRRSEEHVYTIRGPRPTYIMAGPGSAMVFRENLYKRLAEAFFNFEWLMENRPRRFDRKEMEIYDEFFSRLKSHGLELPRYLTSVRRRVRRAVSARG